MKRCIINNIYFALPELVGACGAVCITKWKNFIKKTEGMNSMTLNKGIIILFWHLFDWVFYLFAFCSCPNKCQHGWHLFQFISVKKIIKYKMCWAVFEALCVSPLNRHNAHIFKNASFSYEDLVAMLTCTTFNCAQWLQNNFEGHTPAAH